VRCLVVVVGAALALGWFSVFINEVVVSFVWHSSRKVLTLPVSPNWFRASFRFSSETTKARSNSKPSPETVVLTL
jgi:hypothetical protein